MQASKKADSPAFLSSFLARELPKPVEHHVNDDDVGIKAIETRRYDNIERKAAESAMPPSKNAIRRHPSEELHQMRARNRGNLVPEDRTRFAGTRHLRIVKRETFRAARVKMNLAVVVVGQALKQFRQGALGAVSPVNEWRNNSQPQVSDSPKRIG